MRSDTIGDDKSLTISQFCALEEISRAEFYKMRRAGRGPVVVYPGPGCPRISAKARRDWHRKLEAEAGARQHVCGGLTDTHSDDPARTGEPLCAINRRRKDRKAGSPVEGPNTNGIN
jgi:hypothetical protein